MSSGRVALHELCKSFGDVAAVDSIDLEIEGGEFFSLLGPSGCGKTTTLRLVAGFEQPTSGRILLDGQDVAHVPPHRRNVNTVFQSYALFPHLTVAENVAFGLRYQDVSRHEVDRLVGDALELVRLETFGRRKPGQLSGGQQQRVALARALVLKPRVLLLDEPLGALDAKLRKALQVELHTLQRAVGITFLYVTHDQEEALTMSDRLAVMRGGRIEQVGPPRHVYEEPATAYVADFLGVANVLTARPGGPGEVSLDTFTLRAAAAGANVNGHDVRVVIRPERVRLEPHGTPGENRIPGMVERLVYVGATTQVSVRLASGHSVEALITNDGETPWAQGSPVAAHFPAEAVRILSESE